MGKRLAKPAQRVSASAHVSVDPLWMTDLAGSQSDDCHIRGGEPRLRDTFQMASSRVVFIEEDPARNRSRRERYLQNSRVRAQAARYSHGNRRSLVHRVRRPLPVDASYEPECATVSRPRGFPESGESTNAASASDDPTIHHMMVPYSMIGQGGTDPFDSQALRALHPLIHHALDKTFSIFLPEVVLAPLPVRNQIMANRRRHSQQLPFLYHADISFALALWLNRTPQATQAFRSVVASVINVHKFKALESMIKWKDLAPLDLMVNGISAYGGHVSHAQAIDLDVFPKSPLARTQGLHIFGNMPLPWGFDETEQAIFGDQVPMMILRDQFIIDLVTVGHLAEVTQHDIPPQYPWPYPDMTRDLGEGYLPDDRGLDVAVGESGHGIESGFQVTGEDLLTVLRILIHTTADLDAFHCNRPGALPEWELGVRRNYAQYRLYSLPRLGDFYHLVCRLALLIYSDFVLFPIPPGPGVRPRLSSQLQDLIQYNQQSNDLLNPDFLIWATAMGAMASIGTLLETWYISTLGVSLTLHAVGDNWSALKRLVKRFLWWDHVLDPRLLYLWQQTQVQYTFEVTTIGPEGSTSAAERESGGGSSEGGTNQH